jgi:hypothetical protein
MPLIAALILIAQIVCGVHAARTNRVTPWLYIIIFLGPIGCLIYFITQILPELAHTRAANQVAGDLSRVVNPDKELRRRVSNLDRANTAENKAELGDECLARGLYDDAAELFERALQPPFEADPVLMLGLARARFGQERFDDVVTVLDDLRAENPDLESAEAHLLYARALTEGDRLQEADHEYAYLVDYYPGEEARLRYGVLLEAMGDQAKAAEMFRAVVTNVDRASKHYFRSQKEWYDAAKLRLAEA